MLNWRMTHTLIIVKIKIIHSQWYSHKLLDNTTNYVNCFILITLINYKFNLVVTSEFLCQRIADFPAPYT